MDTNKRPQDCEYGVQSIQGRWVAGRQGLHTANDRGRTKIQGETVGTGAMPGVRGGGDKLITGCAPTNLAHCDEREVGTGGKRGRRGQ